MDSNSIWKKYATQNSIFLKTQHLFMENQKNCVIFSNLAINLVDAPVALSIKIYFQTTLKTL